MMQDSIQPENVIILRNQEPYPRTFSFQRTYKKMERHNWHLALLVFQLVDTVSELENSQLHRSMIPTTDKQSRKNSHWHTLCLRNAATEYQSRVIGNLFTWNGKCSPALLESPQANGSMQDTKPTDQFSRGKPGLHYTQAALRLALAKTPSP